MLLFFYSMYNSTANLGANERNQILNVKEKMKVLLSNEGIDKQMNI